MAVASDVQDLVPHRLKQRPAGLQVGRIAADEESELAPRRRLARAGHGCIQETQVPRLRL